MGDVREATSTVLRSSVHLSQKSFSCLELLTLIAKMVKN